jgi:hypothetical protein
MRPAGFTLPWRVGTSSQWEHATRAAVAAPVEAARAYVPTPKVAHRDETSWRQGDKAAWLGVAVTTWGTVVVVRLSRGGHVARELWGQTFAGILVTDRSRAYHGYPVRGRQRCWAHWLRDFEARRGRGGCSEALGGCLASAGVPAVYVVVSGARGHLATLHIAFLHVAPTPRGRTAFRSGE